jgi:hypothetical protein
MSQSKHRPEGAPRPRATSWTVLRIISGALAIAVMGLAAWSDAGGVESGTSAVQDFDRVFFAQSAEDGEAILINTRVTLPTGEVRRASVIGDSTFCSGGTFRDRQGDTDTGLVNRTFRCPNGTLRIGFTPGFPQGRTQSGPWKVLRQCWWSLGGTGAFEALQGSGEMEVKYERGSDTDGHETFTGTVLPSREMLQSLGRMPDEVNPRAIASRFRCRHSRPSRSTRSEYSKEDPNVSASN